MKAEYIDHMGDDLRVVNAARVSFDKESEWGELEYDGGKETIYFLSDRDEKLIRYLAKHSHWTPFSHAQITLRETVPLFVARQRFKHTVGFTYNEVSRRYVDSEPEFYVPSEWRKKADNKKQGSGEAHEDQDHWNECYLDGLLVVTKGLYDAMIEDGICPEQARMVLPQSMYTSYYTTGSLSAFARAYKLRIDESAQREIRELATQWDLIIRPLFPISWPALVD